MSQDFIHVVKSAHDVEGCVLKLATEQLTTRYKTAKNSGSD